LDRDYALELLGGQRRSRPRGPADRRQVRGALWHDGRRRRFRKRRRLQTDTPCSWSDRLDRDYALELFGGRRRIFSSSWAYRRREGALYGTASSGGVNNNDPACGSSCGVVFKLTPPPRGQTAWTETTLWNFLSADGFFPVTGLTADESGVLYGTTQFGGAFDTPSCSAFGCGVVFKLTGTGFVQ